MQRIYVLAKKIKRKNGAVLVYVVGITPLDIEKGVKEIKLIKENKKD